jgi:hypothetical protein
VKIDTNQRIDNVRPPQRTVRPIVGSAASKRQPHKMWIVAGVVVLVAVVAWLVVNAGLGQANQVDKNKYQAVFLTNGQVYFGKLNGWGGPRPYLTDVYYLQAPNSSSESDAQSPEDNTNTRTLVKLGSELHKPSDKLILNPDAILFVENIEDDGQVVQAIKSKKS